MAGGSERSVPHLPEGSSLEVVEQKDGKVVWRVVKDGSLVEEYNEEDIRFTVSCKFHLFRSEQEADQFYTGKGAKLTADSILDGLVRLIDKTDRRYHPLLFTDFKIGAGEEASSGADKEISAPPAGSSNYQVGSLSKTFLIVFFEREFILPLVLLKGVHPTPCPHTKNF